MRALDIVKIDSGAVGVVVKGSAKGASIRWFDKEEKKCAWWVEGEKGLRVIDNLAAFLSDNLGNSLIPENNPYR